MAKDTGRFNKEFFDLYKMLTTFPRGYNKKNPELISTFVKRLKYVQENMIPMPEHRTLFWDEPSPSLNRPLKQAELALRLGLSKQRVGQYLKADMRMIPEDKLILLYDIYDITPHYLLGYTDDPQGILFLDENGDPEKNDDGSNKVGYYPMIHPLLSYKFAIDVFNDLQLNDYDAFRTLGMFLYSSPKIRKLGIALLKDLIEYEL